MDQSCSGQMAEAIAKRLAPPDTRIFSAAMVPREVPPAAIEVMREVEVEMPLERAKPLGDRLQLLGVMHQSLHLLFTFHRLKAREDARDRRRELGR
jgi:protein-tyrosine-phosphatase